MFPVTEGPLTERRGYLQIMSTLRPCLSQVRPPVPRKWRDRREQEQSGNHEDCSCYEANDESDLSKKKELTRRIRNGCNDCRCCILLYVGDGESHLSSLNKCTTFQSNI